MKKSILMLAAFGMIATSTFAQSQRLNRTNTKPATVTTIKETDQTMKKSDGTLDLSRNPGNGATGVDGTINDATNSGNNNSGAIIDQRSNNTVNDAATTPTIKSAPNTSPTR